MTAGDVQLPLLLAPPQREAISSRASQLTRDLPLYSVNTRRVVSFRSLIHAVADLPATSDHAVIGRRQRPKCCSVMWYLPQSQGRAPCGVRGLLLVADPPMLAPLYHKGASCRIAEAAKQNPTPSGTRASTGATSFRWKDGCESGLCRCPIWPGPTPGSMAVGGRRSAP